MIKVRIKRKPIKSSLRRKIYNQQDGKCAYCGVKVTFIKTNDFFDTMSALDHIIPVKHGGTDEPENLQILCLYCNAKKFDSLTYHDPVVKK